MLMPLMAVVIGLCCLVRAVRMIVVTGGFIAVGCLLYPLGWNNAEVVEACTALAHRYSWGQDTLVLSTLKKTTLTLVVRLGVKSPRLGFCVIKKFCP